MASMIAPLPLDSPRWQELNAHFGNAGRDGDLPSVPSLLARWHEAVGSYREEYEYDDLRESYLHQQTMLDVAYAVVPHLASRLGELDPDRRLDLLDDIALVDAVRQLSAAEVEAKVTAVAAAFPAAMRDDVVQNTRNRLARLPADLEPSYLRAIEQADAIGGPRWRDADDDTDDTSNPRYWRRHVRYLRDSGWRDDDIAFAVRVLRSAEPSELVELVYRASRDEARQALCALEDAPPGWFERTRLRVPDGELGFRAVYRLAWQAALNVEMVLHSQSS